MTSLYGTPRLLTVVLVIVKARRHTCTLVLHLCQQFYCRNINCPINVSFQLPVITNLRNPALKPRHWEHIQQIFGYHFTEEEPLTLGLLNKIDAFDHTEAIEEVSGQASSEASLEGILKKVRLCIIGRSVVNGYSMQCYRRFKDQFYCRDKLNLLYRREYFTGKYTIRKTHTCTKLHPGPEWHIFHILTSEDIDDVISRFFTVVCVNSR